MEFDTTEAQNAREALDQAACSRQEARHLQVMPEWYGPTVGAMIAVYVASSDVARAVHSPWPFLAVALLYSLGIGIAIGAVRRRQGVVGRWDREAVTVSVLGVAACVLVGLGAYAGAWAAGIWARGTVAGACAGATFWGVAAIVNRRIRRTTVSPTHEDRQ